MIDWFYSDPHFGHRNIIDYEHRPFQDVEEMAQTLIHRYNRAVQPTDVCLFMGDVFLTSFDEAKTIMEMLNGRKLLILGNHDRSAKRMAQLGFIVLEGEVVLSMCGRSVRVSHYPYWTGTEDRHGRDIPLAEGRIEVKRKLHPVRRPGEVLLHGHIHGKRQIRDNTIHLGVDAWDYSPVSWEEVEGLVSQV